MTLEMPWKKPYDLLVKEFVDRYTCTITRPDERSLSASFVYPIINGERSEIRFAVDISETRGVVFKEGMVGADDNIEFLQINLFFEHDYHIQIMKESFADLLGKRLHLKTEFQTGNEGFDRRFFIRLKGDEEKRLLSDRNVQDAIVDLAPFSILGIAPPRMFCSWRIVDKDQLSFPNVENSLLGLYRLSDLVH